MEETKHTNPNAPKVDATKNPDNAPKKDVTKENAPEVRKANESSKAPKKAAAPREAFVAAPAGSFTNGTLDVVDHVNNNPTDADPRLSSISA